MNVTRQTLRDMILAEIESLDEDGLIPLEPVGGLGKSTAAVLRTLEWGQDKDVQDFAKDLAGALDDGELAAFLKTLTPAQLTIIGVGSAAGARVDEGQNLVEAVINRSEEARTIAAWRWPDIEQPEEQLTSDYFVRVMGLFQDDHPGRPVEKLKDWLVNTLKPEIDDMLGAFKNKFGVTPDDSLSLLFAYKLDKEQDKPGGDLSSSEWLADLNLDRHEDLGIIHLADWKRIKFKADGAQPEDDPEEILMPTQSGMGKRQDETVLMTVGQFRDMVKEAMEAGMFGNIEKHDTGVNKGDTSRISWGVNLDTKYEGGSKYDVNEFSEYIGNKYGGVNGALDNPRLRRIMGAARTAGKVPEYVDMETNTEINPPPSGPPRDVAVEAIKAEIDKYINKKEPGKELENPNIDIPNIDIDAHNIFTHWKYFGVPTDYLDPNDVEGVWQSYTTNESVLMTVGQFRRLVREAATAGSSREAASNDVGALFARILKVEDEEQKNDLLNRLDNAGQDIGQRDEIAAELLDIEEPVSDFIHPAEDQHRSMERLEQLRKESDDILKKLLSSMSSEIILLKLRRLVYNDDSSRKRLAKWMEDQAMGIPDDALLKNWLDEIGPEEAYDDLAKLEDKLMKGSSMEERINRGIDSLKQ